MADYKTMYAVLCKAINDVITPLANISSAKEYACILYNALNTAEEIYIDTTAYAEYSDDPKIIYLKTEHNKP